MYAYAVGERSTRAIERRCVQDVAFRVIAANRVPDHTTIARFRVRHEQALAGLFSDVLVLCAKAGLVSVATVAVDGTKLQANASLDANRDFEALAKDILAEADAVDAAEDAEHGSARGDELPSQFATRDGRQAWIRDAKRELERQRDRDPQPIPGKRPDRLAEARRRLLQEQRYEAAGNAAYEQFRKQGVDKRGRPLPATRTPYEAPVTPQGMVNTTDPDSRIMRTHIGTVQGYNAQAGLHRRSPDHRRRSQHHRRRLQPAGPDAQRRLARAHSGRLA